MTATTPSTGEGNGARENTRNGESSLGYHTSKELAQSRDAEDRERVAAAANTPRELAYFLSDDKEATVRRAVAGNPALPHQAFSKLARDPEAVVRAVMADRLARLFPDLDSGDRDKLTDLVTQLLEALARDEALHVRETLARAVAEVGCAPPKVAIALARDVERSVAEPVLAACLTISDDELITLMTARPQDWVVEAISSRPVVSERLADAVAAQENDTATGLLIDNAGAELSDPTLDMLVDRARANPDWQMRLARRASLPPRLTHKLAQFASAAVGRVLEARGDFDEGTQADIVNTLSRRLESQAAPDAKTAHSRVERLFKRRTLDDTAVADAIALGDTAFVVAALARLAALPADTIRKILDSQSGRAVTALVWYAGLGMRVALLLQRDVAKIPPPLVVNARGGTDFPMSPEAMRDMLGLFGVDAPL